MHINHYILLSEIELSLCFIDFKDFFYDFQKHSSRSIFYDYVKIMAFQIILRQISMISLKY